MKIKVKRAFLDKNDLSHRYNVGEVIDFDKERALHIISIGFGVEVPVAEPAKEAAEISAKEEVKVEQPNTEKVESAAPATKKGGRKKKVSE